MTEHTVDFQTKPNYQRIRKDKVVRLRYLLRDTEADQTLAYRDDMVYLHGGYGSAFPKVEAVLEGKEVGDGAEVTLAPGEAYGEPDPGLVITVPHAELPEEVRHLGAQLEGEAPDGSSRPFRVVAMDEATITVDGNHPLAGRHLEFHFEVLDIRDASAAEIEAGYGFALSVEG